MFKFMMNIMAWAIGLALCGELIGATAFFKKEAIKSHSIGTLKLGKWSRKLQSGGR